MQFKTRLNFLFEKKRIEYLLQKNSKKKRACGIDGVYPSGLRSFWKEHGEDIKKLILDGKYVPLPAEKVMIPKPGSNKKRELKLYCVPDRMIMHGLYKLIVKYFDKVFSDSSFGFRPGRGCYQALNHAIELMNEGYYYAISIDLESFFDMVNHEILSKILVKHIKDKRIIDLIMTYMKTKVVYKNHVFRNYIGVPQGSALSPLLANIYLNEFDQRMDLLGYRFARYADDIVLFARNEQEKEKVYSEAENFLLRKLKLKINQEKTVIEKGRLLYLGYEIKKCESGIYQFYVGEKKTEKMYEKMKVHLQKNLSDEEWIWRLGAFNRGWLNYYKYTDCDSTGEIAARADKIERGCIKKRGLSTKSKGYVSMSEWWNMLVCQRNPEVEYE